MRFLQALPQPRGRPPEKLVRLQRGVPQGPSGHAEQGTATNGGELDGHPLLVAVVGDEGRGGLQAADHEAVPAGCLAGVGGGSQRRRRPASHPFLLGPRHGPTLGPRDQAVGSAARLAGRAILSDANAEAAAVWRRPDQGPEVSYDWGAGQYERTASQLDAAAARVVDVASILPTERVLDLACGTGNGALRAARVVGARVTGADRAERLVAVARERCGQESLDAGLVTADALALPFADGSFDVALSIFGVIFAEPGERVAAELLRVARPGGRIVLSAWPPTGPIRDIMDLVGEAMASVRPPDDDPAAPTSWWEAEALEELFAPATVVVRTERLAFVGPSARGWAVDQFDHHPGWAAARSVLEPAGRWEELAHRAIAILEAANEDPTAFRTTSTYLIATIKPA